MPAVLEAKIITRKVLKIYKHILF